MEVCAFSTNLCWRSWLTREHIDLLFTLRLTQSVNIGCLVYVGNVRALLFSCDKALNLVSTPTNGSLTTLPVVGFCVVSQLRLSDFIRNFCGKLLLFTLTLTQSVNIGCVWYVLVTFAPCYFRATKLWIWKDATFKNANKNQNEKQKLKLSFCSIWLFLMAFAFWRLSGKFLI